MIVTGKIFIKCRSSGRPRRFAPSFGIFISRLLVVATLLASMLCHAQPSEYIRSIEVRLYYHHSGTWSEPLTGKEALWNTIIGEGDAKEPSNAILVDVALTGKGGSFDPTGVVQLVVNSELTGKVLSTTKQRIGVFSKQGIYHAPFFVSGTGCEPLVLTVSAGAEMKTAKVPFACGE